MSHHLFPGSLVCLAVGLAAAFPATLAAADASGTPPIAGVPSATPYFMPESISRVQLSPNGQRVGFLALKDDRAYVFALMETNGQPPRPILQPEGQSITHFWWKDDDLLLLVIQDLFTAQRSFATYNFKTANYRALSVAAEGMSYVSSLNENPDEMLFASLSIGGAGSGYGANKILSSDLIRINVRTGTSKPDIKDPEHIERWFVNPEGQVVAGWQDWEKEWALWWRKTPADRWQATRMPKKQEYPDFIPLAVAPDGRRLFGFDFRRRDGVDAVYYDPATAEREVVVGNASSLPIWVDNWGFKETPALLRYEGEPLKEKYLEPALEAFMQNLQKTLPGLTVDVINFSRDESRAVVLASGDRVAGEYLVVERATGQFTRIGPRRAALNRDRTFVRRPFEFKASDGRPITGVVTVPNGNAKVPVLLYMASLVRARVVPVDNPIVHYFASLGYAVAEVNYRGINAFSSEFREAGLFQQDKGIPRDLGEAVAHLESLGIADASRVVVYCAGPSAVPAFAYAAQSKAVKAVLAFTPRTDIERMDARILEDSARLEIDLTRMAGPNFGYQNYRKSADPSANAVKAGVPVFVHHTDVTWAGRTTQVITSIGDNAFVSAIRKSSKLSEATKASEVMKELGYRNGPDVVDWKVAARATERGVELLHKAGMP